MTKNENTRLLREKDVLKIIPVSKACWWRGVKSGRFPKPVKLGPKTTVWKSSDIQRIIDNPEQFFGYSGAKSNV